MTTILDPVTLDDAAKVLTRRINAGDQDALTLTRQLIAAGVPVPVKNLPEEKP